MRIGGARALAALTIVVAAPVWALDVVGTRKLTLDAAGLERLLGKRRGEMKLSVKGTDRLYSGFPLGWLAALVDDPGEATGELFDRELWELGYEITITARDGYSATLETAGLAPEAVLLADREGGASIPLSIVGSVDRSLWVKDVVSIELGLEGAWVPDAEWLAATGAVSPGKPGAAPEFSLLLELNGVTRSFPLAELERSALYMEGPGSFTTSAGTTYTGRYGGVRLAALIGQFVTLAPTDTVEFVAMDGYRMSYAGADILDRSKGEWILAFRLDGDYLPRDPGYVRTVKVGPEAPSIDGHLSVKMVERVELRQAGYRNFELEIDGAMQARVDRQSMQSCLNCHGVKVQYERKGQSALYRGVPLWRLLAYGDDPERAPHRVPSPATSYDVEAAVRGYQVELIAADGFADALDSRALHANDGVILAMEKDGGDLPEGEWPLVLAWDAAAAVPDGIKPVRQVARLRLAIPAR